MFDVVLPQSIPLAETVIGAIIASNACKGVSKLGTLIFGKQFRLNEYKNTLMKAQAERDAKAIEAEDVRFDGATLQPALALPSLPPNVPLEYLPMLEGQRQESSNLNANLGIAFGILADTDDKDISDESVSPDWFARWRREAQGIGDQELQNIWGRILAEEVKKPQSISLRTLDILRNVTAKDAELFCKFVKLRIMNLIPKTLYETKVSQDITEILHLQHLGLVNSGSSFVAKPALIDVIPDGCGYPCNGFFLFFSLKEELKILIHDVQGYIISPAGVEILKIADVISDSKETDIIIVGEFLWKRLPEQVTEMLAYPLTSEGFFSRERILKKWMR